MAKKIETSIAMINPATFKSEPVLDNVAFSIVKTGEKLYSVFAIDFNTDGSSGNVRIVAPDIDLFEAQHQFKMAVTDAGLFNILDKK